MRELNIAATGIFRAILAILGNRSHCRIDNAKDRYMPVVVERMDENRFTLTHYSELNGDLLADPDMTFWISPERMIYAVAYRNDFMGVDQQAIEFVGVRPAHFHHAAQREITGFAELWLKNLAAQQGIQMPESLDTPRGLFRYGFDSEQKARAAGYSHWFTHDGVKIFAGGPPTPTGSSSLAVAVRPGRVAFATD